MGVPLNLSKSRGRVTQTSVVAVVIYQSTHEIYHMKGTSISVLMMHFMMQWIKELSLQIR